MPTRDDRVAAVSASAEPARVAAADRPPEAPWITVYLPTRNRADLLCEAVESVLAQEFRDFELLVVDDASDDGTPDVGNRYARGDSRVRYIRQPSPKGAPAARNRAIDEARGTYVTGIDDDDLMLPQRLGSLAAATDDRYSFLCTSLIVEREGWRRPAFTDARTIALDALLHWNVVGNQGFILTDRVRAVGGYDESLTASQDYDLWTRLVERFGPALRIADPSYVFRADIAPTGMQRSSRAGKGAAEYTNKHARLMNRWQRRSQRLIQDMATDRPIRPRNMAASFAPATASVWLRHLAHALPLAATVARRYRGHRSLH